MSTRLVTNNPRVFAYVSERVGGLAPGVHIRTVGIERDGELIAGAVYQDFNGHNVWMHIAAEPGCRWLNRSALRYAFEYPFIEMGVKRITGIVSASNTQARRFDEALGFKEEAVLRGAAPDGGDLIIYAMWREECRYVSVPSN